MSLVGIVRDTTKDGLATISINRVSACGGHCSSCGASCESQMHDVKVRNDINASVGDIVNVEFSEKASLKASLILYLIPLIGFIAGIIVGYLAKLGEGKSLLFGLLGLVFSLIIVYFLGKNYNNKSLEIKISKLRR